MIPQVHSIQVALGLNVSFHCERKGVVLQLGHFFMLTTYLVLIEAEENILDNIRAAAQLLEL